MSTSRQPITPSVFAEAIKELPLESLHAEAAKLTNDMAKLIESNVALEAEKAVETEEGIKFLDDVIAENEGVVRWKEERIELLKVEVENRGQIWVDPRKAGEEEGEHQNGQQRSRVNGAGNDTAALHGQHGRAVDGDEGVYL